MVAENWPWSDIAAAVAAVVAVADDVVADDVVADVAGVVVGYTHVLDVKANALHRRHCRHRVIHLPGQVMHSNCVAGRYLVWTYHISISSAVA